LETDFPVLIADSVNWLAARGVQQDSDRAIRAGQPVTIQSRAQEVMITEPSGRSRTVAVREGVTTFSETDKAGLYTTGSGAPFAVSLLSESESDTRPRDVSLTRTGEAGTHPAEAESHREIWRWLAFAGLAVLAIEWTVFLKRSS